MQTHDLNCKPMYVNVIITRLRASDYGCRLHNYYMGCIMYADDLILIFASIMNLQHVLDICFPTGNELGIKFNGLKSKCLCIGSPIIKDNPLLLLDNQIIEWPDKVKYLGVWIKSSTHFEIDVSECRRKFFISANTVLSNCKSACEMVKLKLLESHCLPLLTYAADSGCIDNNSLSMFNTCWNSIYRRIFGYFRWESVRNVMACLNKLNINYLVNLRRVLFIKQMFVNVSNNGSLV